MARLEQEIYDLAGRRFNIASPSNCARCCSRKRASSPARRPASRAQPAPIRRRWKNWRATGEPLPRKMLEQRQIAKLKSTYVDALPALVNEQTGRIHASFNQTVAATGRLSSSDPNLQNIPVRTELGGQIRQAFLPAEGWVLLTADYSQIELRLLAHFSGDEALGPRLCRGPRHSRRGGGPDLRRAPKPT